jgi:L-alanine-DL-glutamate epimerase-like enolase superfamily enzyme
MQIDRILIYDLAIPFRTTVRHSLYARSQTQSIVVVARDAAGHTGFGEGTPRDYVTGEPLDRSLAAAEALARQMVGRRLESAADLEALLTQVGASDPAVANPAAFCALEIALLDLWAGAARQPLHRLLLSGGPAAMPERDHRVPERLVYSGVIPFTRSGDELERYLGLVRRLDLAALKVKVDDSDQSLSRLNLIRRKLGDGIDLRVDANGAFTAQGALSFIRKAVPVRLSAVEQPVAGNDLDGLKQVTRNSEVPIIADESMYTAHGPYHLIDHQLCHGLNIRLSSCGGFRKAQALCRQAVQNRMTVVLGAHVGESAILSFAGRHLAAICPGAAYLEGSFSKYVLQEDLVRDDISLGAGGAVLVPQGPGLGVDIDTAVIEKWARRCADLAAP